MLPILRKFSGLYATEWTRPDPRGLAGVFDCILPHADGRIRWATLQFVIRNDAELDRFIDRIPRRRMICEPNPPPSDDPLLQRPAIDFAHQMMLAIVSHEPNRFIEVDIGAVALQSDGMTVDCHVPEPGRIRSKVISYGYYCAVIVPRFDGEVVVTWHDATSRRASPAASAAPRGARSPRAGSSS